MNPALKRKLIMPFVMWKWKKKLQSGMRSAQEIELKMKEYHNEFLTIQKQGKLDSAKEISMKTAAIRRDALAWALRLDGITS